MSRPKDYTLATSTASDDFLLLDGATNGTRKLSANSPTFSGGLTVGGTASLNGTSIPASKTLVVTTDKISTLAATTSAELAGVISDETGSGALVFANSPTLVTPNIGAATGTSVNLSGAGTFGGNLTVSGTGTFGGAATSQGATGGFQVTRRDTNANAYILYSAAGNISIFNNSVGADFLTGDNTTNSASFAGSLSTAGNLTVSGTGTSSVAGNLNIGEPTGSGYRLYVKAGFGLALGGSYIECGEYDKPCSILNHTNPAVSANLFQIQKQGSGVFTVSSAGNLTVSGTGTNYFVGDITSTATGNNQWQITKGAATNYATLAFSETTSGAAWAIGQRTTAAAGGANRFSFYGSGVGGDAMQITYLGNLLIGTTTDGGQKLQVNGTMSIYGASTEDTLKITRASNTANGMLKFITTSTEDWIVGQRNLSDSDFHFYSYGISGDALKLARSTGDATFAGGIIGMTQGNVDNISDDGVASFTPLYNRGFIVINNPDYSQNALIAYFKAGSSYLLYSITKSADVTLNNSTTLTGTTGTDGKLNIGYNNSIIYIENRLGGIANFQRYALGGTN